MTDEELVSFVSEFKVGILDGGTSHMRCAMVCWPLQSLLSIFGVETTAMKTPVVKCDFGEIDHMWLRLQDGRALDPTADQFNTKRRKYPEVYIGKPTRLHKGAVLFSAPRSPSTNDTPPHTAATLGPRP